MLSSSQNFRHDINGLRAWAVIAVVLFHFGIPGFAGGFVGVDVFFVISGFLMMQIIITGLEQDRFSLWRFYLARARRIIPALLALCSTLLCLGWFWLPTLDYSQLAKHAFTAILFLSNVKFWKEAGYFDSVSHEKWLLHTWSLSVEWQFYIILPLALMLIWRLGGKNGFMRFIILAGAVSFGLSIIMSSLAPSAGFFLIPSRAWEMLAGGIVWRLTQNRTLSGKRRIYTEWLGMLCIAIAIVGCDASKPWPGYNALLPVIGAMLVLAAGRQDSPLTSNPVAARLGVSSYSIYLWHWPIVVLLVYTNAQSEMKWVVAGLLASVLLGELSLRLIETPVRKWLSRQTTRQSVCTIGIATMLVAALCVTLFTVNFSGRLPQQIDLIANESTNMLANRDECFAKSGFSSPSCIYGGENIRVIIVGDSHGDAMISAVESALPNQTDGLLNLTYAGCPTLFGANVVPGALDDNIQCSAFNQWIKEKLSTLDNNIPAVVINRTSAYAFGQQIAGAKQNQPSVYFSKVYRTPEPGFLSEFKTSLVDTLCEMATERQIYVVRPVPEMLVNVPKTLSRLLSFGGSEPDISISETDYRQRHAFVWQAQDEAAKKCGVKILDPLPYLCEDGKCAGTHNGRPIYFDDNHLSEYGNKLLVPMFKTLFSSASK
ncbi:acyltransferase family protein [Serratia nematodiphila]|uniref:Peptidoglycan/LPS O-acetylase OafA/YrhL, contains acyltransferase and SGNH-hydrolase domains n=3 Tax=Serratia TaxID=613 RepID=A0A1G5HGB6_9GAMM|nr:MULTISPECIES: acyltransferase family protein [Serratia]KFF86124.1 acyltransferase [Serratia nematodiphila DZ0503SBS1]SCY62519.1 Peptidoglycan/LPS O-acetylase OafA/YrhL, contains acyltransferase and SGNH-hydrolase domains [Serratia nematodiphila]